MKYQRYIRISIVVICFSLLSLFAGYTMQNRALSIFGLIAGMLTCLIVLYMQHSYASRIKELKNIDLSEASNLSDIPIWKDLPYHEEIEDLLNRIIDEIKRENEMEVYDRQATLAALQSQINPHFLYNTLESIRGQALIDDNREIATMLEALGNFFRYSISRKVNIVTLLEEIQNIKGYMLIQNYRFSNRYSLKIDYIANEEEVSGCYVPKLMLQPIVENAIVHAFETKTHGTITVSIDEAEGALLITVSDDGGGMTTQQLENLNAKIEGIGEIDNQTNHTGIALENVNKRIHILFGKQYGIHAYSTEGHGTDIEIYLPKITVLSNEVDHE